jgi:hypothetical protein
LPLKGERIDAMGHGMRRGLILGISRDREAQQQPFPNLRGSPILPAAGAGAQFGGGA